jgi:hypothetical protein
MKKYACQYKIIRFTPFVETEEFANIGVAVFCPASGQLTYRLAPTRFGRITRFFHDMDSAVYTETKKTLDAELARAQILLKDKHGMDMGKLIFQEFTREKGGLVQFSGIRAILTTDLEQEVQTLYDHYVGRSFNTREYREHVLERKLRTWLRQIDLDRTYKKAKLSAGLIDVNLPFVNKQNSNVKATIKPIAFDQKTRTAMVEHADSWVAKVKHLVGSTLEPANILVPVDFDSIIDEDVREYVDHFQSQLKDMGVRTGDVKDQKAIADFAQEHA